MGVSITLLYRIGHNALAKLRAATPPKSVRKRHRMSPAWLLVSVSPLLALHVAFLLVLSNG
jgi:paraquat-inducible protein B